MQAAGEHAIPKRRFQSQGFALKLNRAAGLDNVVILGDTTFGKGIGQYTVPLKNGYYFIATMFTWETPNGDTIHQKGIPADKEFTVDTLSEELGVELSVKEDTE